MKKQLLLITTLLLYVMGLSAATVESPPTDFVNLYSLQYQSDVHTQVDMAGAVDAGAEKLLVGPGQGWG
ncbi:MAG: hypothetical protein PHI57_06155, partial [Bacteroidales bacterium]|nr:hypothetical protein [Bacteroidales bacterium]